MMKKIATPLLLVIIVALMAAVPASNELDVTWGKDIPGESFIAKIIGANDEGIFTLAVKKKTLFLQCYKGKEITPSYSKEIIIPKSGGNELDFEDIFFLKNKLVMFTSNYNGKTNTYTSYAHEVSFAGKIGRPIKMISIEAEAKNRKGKFKYAASLDESKLMVFHTNVLRKKDVQKATLILIDQELDIIGKAEHEYPKNTQGRKYEMSEPRVDNDGSMYVMYSEKTEFNSLPSILIFDKKNDYEKKKIELPLGAKRITALGITINQNNNLVVTGLSPLNNSIGGAFYFEVSKDDYSIIKEKYSDFADELKSQYQDVRSVAKGGGISPYNYVYRYGILGQDGEITLGMEYYTIREERGQAVFTYGSALIISFGNEGEVLWANRVRKRQSYSATMAGFGVGGVAITFQVSKDETIYYSYLLGASDKNVYVIYNDHPDNLRKDSKSSLKLIYNRNSSVPILCTIDAKTGEMTRKVMFEAKDFEVRMRPKIYKQVSDNEIIVFGSKGRKDKLGIIKF